MQDLVIIGAGTAVIVKMLHAINKHSPQWNLLGFVDDDEKKWGTDFYGYPVLGGFEELKKLCNTKVLCNIYGGDIWTRLKVLERLEPMDLEYASLIYPGVDLESASVGYGCVIMGGSWIQTDVTLGNHTCIGLNCTIGHDAVIDDYAWIGPGSTILGRVHIKEGATLGAGATIKGDITVGKYSLVGIGSVVIKDVLAKATVMGNPARVININNQSRRHPY